MQYIDKVVYINLDRRTDRREQIETELRTLGIGPDKAIRQPGGRHPSGSPNAGCNMAHTSALNYSIDNKLGCVLILEDDFQFAVNREQLDNVLEKAFKSKWDMLQLTGNDFEWAPHDDTLRRTLKAKNAAAYIVRGEEAMIALRDIIASGIEALAHTGAHWLYQNDVIWWKFMNTHVCMHVWSTCIGGQRESYSDLSGVDCKKSF